MTDPGFTLAQLQSSVFGKTRDQVEQELRDARALITRALRNFDRLTPGAVISLATHDKHGRVVRRVPMVDRGPIKSCTKIPLYRGHDPALPRS